MTPGRAVFTVVVATVLGLALVQQSVLIRRSGYCLEEMRQELAELGAERAVHEAHLSKLRSPRRVRSMVEWLGLDLKARPRTAPGALSPHQPWPQQGHPTPIDIRQTIVTREERPAEGRTDADALESVEVASRL